MDALLISGSEVRALHGSPVLIAYYQTVAGSQLRTARFCFQFGGPVVCQIINTFNSQ